ncbi:MAG TPA: DUF4157 domain-containing protein [Allosphingosinicella sp.]
MGKQRKLTAGEIALARTAFEDKIDYARVRLSDGPGSNPAAHIAFMRGNPAITIGNTIYFKEGFSADFSAAGADGATFMHEMTHVWQYRTLGMPAFYARYGAELARANFKPGDMYKYKDEARFGDAMLEAQAQMVGDYHHALSVGNASARARIARNLAGSGLYGMKVQPAADKARPTTQSR